MSLPPRFNFAEHLFALNRERAARTAYIDDLRRTTADHVANVQLGQFVVGQVEHLAGEVIFRAVL